ncbi:endonuclease NucS [Microbulbifer sp. MLAF003]|uniref:endonuclease NucS domain-containing protein n=1 Tax=unclassified Microbulbifer TaxID=2619833 RepID=UPI0024AE118D|nr:endonuclease NucS domain-containing protein [Microbulbifer sp. MLAF003]WHI50494.1 endonuclease NucS [Microbulbifer sp. MLAF003]
MRRFNVVIPKDDGGIEIHAMKSWLRSHPEHLPEGLNPSSDNSHQFRNALRSNGWHVEELPDEVRLFILGANVPEQAIDAVLGEVEDDDVFEEAAFALEHQLRDFIAHNMASLSVGGRRFHLYQDGTGCGGIEFSTEVGPIDILAVDTNGNFVVFELKRARAPDKALGQLLRYMGWIKAMIGKDKEVAGVIVAKPISKNLRYAVSVISNVSLYEYQVRFDLTAVEVSEDGA